MLTRNATVTGQCSDEHNDGYAVQSYLVCSYVCGLCGTEFTFGIDTHLRGFEERYCLFAQPTKIISYVTTNHEYAVEQPSAQSVDYAGNWW